MAFSNRRSTSGRTPPGSQDEDSADERRTPVAEESLHFDDANGLDGFLIRDSSAIVRIHPSEEPQQSDSSKFRFKLLVDYAWETQYTPGRMVATHIANKFVAYTVHAKGVGALRIMDLVTQERCLMKTDLGSVKDVEFMHKEEDIYIGFIDEHGTFYINKIHQDVQSGKLSYRQIFRIALDGEPKKSDFRRFLWCKFVPDELIEVASVKDCAYQFAVLQDDMIYAGNLAQMVNKHEEGSYTVNEIRDVLIIIDTHSGPVTDASFAPDGTALATASKDGTVKFFQMYFQDKDGNPPRCLYSWEPHNGKPIDRLMFLDNHSIRPTTESQYWKFMITFTENMSEMKLFTCKTWDCLQTIHFTDSGQWKMEIDVTARYLLATDIGRKAIYLMHFQHNDETARVDWIRELSLPFNVLSFNLTHASRLRMQEIRTKGYLDCVAGDAEDYKADAELVYLETNIVQPKSLQQGVIAIIPPQTFCRSNGHHISFQPHVSYKEVPDLETVDPPTLADDDDEEDDDDDMLLNDATISNKSSTQLPSSILPDDTSPVLSLLAHTSLGSLRKKPSLSPTLDTGASQETPSVAQMSEQLSSLIGISPGGASARPPSSGHGTATSHRTKSPSPARHSRSGIEEFLMPREITSNANGTVSKASSSSSPSREVEEILSPKNTEMISHRTDTTLEDLLNAAVSMDSVENGNLTASILSGGTTENHFQKPAVIKKPSLVKQNQLDPVAEKVASMVDMMGVQANEMQDLKREVGRLHMNLKQSEDIHALRKLVETYFKESQHKMSRLEESMKNIEAQERLRITQNQQNNSPLPPNLAELLAVSVGNVVRKEIEAVVPSTLERMYEPSRMNVQAQVDKLTSTLETKLTQNVAHIFQRDKIWESLTANFKTVTKSIFEQTFNEIFTNTVYPRCQNVAREMFAQINEAFSAGTSQYLHGLQDILEVERKKDKTPETIRAHINNMQDHLSSALQVEVEAQMLRVISGLQGSVVRQLEESISRELSHAFQEQKKYFEISVLPRTVTPAVSISDHLGYGASPNMNDPEQIKRSLLNLAKSGEIISAFVQACNYGEVSILMHLCKNIDPGKVFEAKLPHQTHVSILQNMVTDIHHETETKLAYLNTAIGTLDTTDRKTFQSVGRVLPVFQASVAKFISQNPNSKLISNIKLLEMALVGICQQMNSPQVQQTHSGHHQQAMGSQHSFAQY